MWDSREDVSKVKARFSMWERDVNRRKIKGSKGWYTFQFIKRCWKDLCFVVIHFCWWTSRLLPSLLCIEVRCTSAEVGLTLIHVILQAYVVNFGTKWWNVTVNRALWHPILQGSKWGCSALQIGCNQVGAEPVQNSARETKCNMKVQK